MKTRNTIFLLFLTITSVFAQFPEGLDGNGKITGVLVDSLNNQPIEFATLALFREKDLKKPIDGTITDEKGNFILKNIPAGKFLVRFSFIGYNDKFLKINEITTNNANINLGNVILSSNVKILNEVVVSGQAAMIEERVDRLVYNADKDLSAKGGDATDILRKVPLLSVDLDGNVQLRGSSNLRVLINNKPSTIMASSIADALKMIPADEIKTVEVITSPSSKYDAEGTAGIINIITKKSNVKGYSLNTDLSGGNRGGGLGLNGSLRTGKVGFTLGGYGRLNNSPSTTEFEQQTKGQVRNITTKQFGTAKDQMVFGRYSIGADYDISKNKSLSGGARFGTRSFNRDQDLQIIRLYEGTQISNTNQNIASNNPSLNWDFNLDYLHIIKPGKEFSVSTLYSRSTANSDFVNKPFEISSSNSGFTNKNLNLNEEYTIQADYVTPIKKNQILEFGGKGIFREVNSSFNYFLGTTTTQDPNRPSGSLKYNQNIAAGYLSYTYATKNKYNFKLGARYELTDINANQNENIAIDLPKYSNLVPSINISKTYGGKYTAKIGYNRRIQRPGLQQLNPNVNFVNPQSISQGNAKLQPEIADNIEASLSASIKKIYMSLGVFSRNTGNSISQMSTPLTEAQAASFNLTNRDGIVYTTYENIGKVNAYGVNWNGNLTITPKWMLNGGVEAFYSIFNSQSLGLSGVSVPINNQGWNVNGRMFSFVTLPKGYQIQAFGFVRGGQVSAMGRTGGFGIYSLGARKDFKNKKGSIGLSTQNFFTKSIAIKSNLESPLFFQNNVNNMFNRGISVNISYKIGKQGDNALTPRKRAKGVKNDDVKDGGSNDTQQTQPAASGTGRSGK